MMSVGDSPFQGSTHGHAGAVPLSCQAPLGDSESVSICIQNRTLTMCVLLCR